MTIADEVHSQLTKAMASYMGVVGTAAARGRICQLRSDYVSLYDARSMNGPTQSGGHWNAAFGLLARTSDDVGSPSWSSRSVDGSANGILYTMESILRQRGAASHGCATNRKRRAMGVAAPVPSLSYNSFEFRVFAYGLSVQDCSGAKGSKTFTAFSSP
jgi:hypothetical protein